jgi:hypothetical protein
MKCSRSRGFYSPGSLFYVSCPTRFPKMRLVGSNLMNKGLHTQKGQGPPKRPRPFLCPYAPTVLEDVLSAIQ